MNGFHASVMTELGSYDEVKQSLILKGIVRNVNSKICARGHTIYVT